MAGHYWIKQCIELLLSISNHQVPLSTPNNFATLPLPTSFVTSVSDHYGQDKFSPGGGGMYAASGGGPGSMDSFASMTADILMDFDFISAPASMPERSASTDVEMTDMSGTSEGEFGYEIVFFE